MAARKYWLRMRRLLGQRVLHTDDTPHAIALGAGLATLVAFLPLVGFQTVIAISLAALFRANKAICVPIVWITNPFTIIPVYGACFGLGRFALASSATADEVVVLNRLQRQHETGLLEPSLWSEWLDRLANFSVELWAGCAIVGTVGGVAAYFLVRRGVVAYRERRRQRVLRRNLFRTNLKAEQVLRRDGNA